MSGEKKIVSKKRGLGGIEVVLFISDAFRGKRGTAASSYELPLFASTGSAILEGAAFRLEQRNLSPPFPLCLCLHQNLGDPSVGSLKAAHTFHPLFD